MRQRPQRPRRAADRRSASSPHRITQRRTGPSPRRSRIGLALAGGGPLGAMYEIGALCALEECLDGLDFTAMDGYVGVSAGGFIAAGLVNGLSPRDLCASFIENRGPAHDVFDPSLLMRPAITEIASRLLAFPAFAAEAGWDFLMRRRSFAGAMERLGQTLPTGLFSSEAIHEQLSRQFSQPGRTNDFRELDRKLVLVATDLDTGQSMPFGQPGHDHVPISRAVQASSALPGLFPPVEIGGRFYVDGALKKTVHASVLLDEGMDLVICLNPLVPFDGRSARRHRVLEGGDRRPARLVDGGLPTVLAQTFRTLIHSRLELGFKGYERSHPDVDVVLFEPDHRDAEMFLAPTFSYSQRRVVAEHAYQQTRQMLRDRRAELVPRLAAHGVRYNEDVLGATHRTLLKRRLPDPRRQGLGSAARRLEHTLDDLEQVLIAQRATA